MITVFVLFCLYDGAVPVCQQQQQPYKSDKEKKRKIQNNRKTLTNRQHRKKSSYCHQRWWWRWWSKKLCINLMPFVYNLLRTNDNHSIRSDPIWFNQYSFYFLGNLNKIIRLIMFFPQHSLYVSVGLCYIFLLLLFSLFFLVEVFLSFFYCSRYTQTIVKI